MQHTIVLFNQRQGAFSDLPAKVDQVTDSRLPSEEYPRTLIVYLSCINQTDQHGMSLRNWFADWPRERLAQIYSGNERGDERFCGHTFKLGPQERRFGRLFFALKGSALGEAASPVFIDESTEGGLSRLSWAAVWRHRVSRILVESGLWELIFPPVISPGLKAWLNDFQPEVIYCQGYTLSFVWLALALRRELGLPICFHVADDWPTFLYRDSIVAWAIRPLVEHSARELITSAAVRFAIGPTMAAEYESRYGVPVQSLMQCDNIERFRAVTPRRVVEAGDFSIVYTGSLELGRWAPLADLCSATQLLQREGLNVTVTAFASAVPPEAINILREMPHLQILPPPPHDEVPAVLKGADILFLPETFNPGTARMIRLAVSTKAHLYMMSERPILVYAPSITGIVDYARREGWAYVVDRQDVGLLADGVQQLLVDRDLVRQLVQTGVRVALKNHDERVVRQRLVQSVQQLAVSVSL